MFYIPEHLCFRDHRVDFLNDRGGPVSSCLLPVFISSCSVAAIVWGPLPPPHPQGPTAGRWWSQDLTPGRVAFKSAPLATGVCSCSRSLGPLSTHSALCIGLLPVSATTCVLSQCLGQTRCTWKLPLCEQSPASHRQALLGKPPASIPFRRDASETLSV